jgi:alpha-glucosidase
MEERYREFAKAYGFDTTGRHYIPFAMDNKKWAQTYFNVILRPIEKQGVDFWWIDWQQWLENKAIKGLSNTWWLNYTFFTNMERREDKRPLLFHRWGGLGNHRYQIGFSGDTYVTWESLAFQPYFTATASNVGYGYWSHDIGGHQAGKPNSEMYLRWLQWGAFSPILRTHFTKTLTIDRRIWKHDEYFELMRDAIQFRYQLVPYIYTAAREAYDTGVSICRPMYYDYPESQEAYDFKDQYMFGKDMLIAPITEKVSQETGQALKLVWLPEGTWYKWFSGSIIKGGYVVERNYSLNEIPLFVKTGSIIPMIPKRSNLQQRIDTLVLTIIPGGKGETRIYEDDGATSEYKKDQFTFTKVTKTIIEDTAIQITVFPREGSYKNIAKTRAYEFRFPCMFPPTSVMVNEKKYPYSTDGKSGTWTYDGSQLAIIVQTPNIECTEWVDLALSFAQNTQLKLNLLNGKIGIMSRLPKIVELMTNEVNRHDYSIKSWKSGIKNYISTGAYD